MRIYVSDRADHQILFTISDSFAEEKTGSRYARYALDATIDDEYEALRVLKAALNDTKRSNIKANKLKDCYIIASAIVSQIKDLQKAAPEDVRVEIDFDTFTLENFDDLEVRYNIYCKDTLFRTSLTYDEATSTIATLIMGISLARKIEVETPAGIIKAEISADPGQTGISTFLQPTGTDSEIDLSYVLVCEDPEYQELDGVTSDDIVIMTYADPCSETYSVKAIVKGANIKKAIENIQ